MTRRGWIGWIVVGIAFAMLGVGMAVVLDGFEKTDAEVAELRSELAAEREKTAESQAVIDDLAADAMAMQDQLRALGEVPVAAPPADRIDDADERPAPVPPSAAQVRAAVSSVLATNPDLVGEPLIAAVTSYLVANPPPAGPPGADGEDGEDARPATPEEIFVVVSAVCANDACRGPAGADGVDGEDAPPVTDDQIAAQLAAYCDSRGECIGPAGPMGPGGPAGRGVVDVDCNADGHLVFTFDKPPLEDVIEDACQVPVLPDPTDPPTSDPTEEP